MHRTLHSIGARSISWFSARQVPVFLQTCLGVSVRNKLPAGLTVRPTGASACIATCAAMELQQVVAALKQMADPALAGSWDNVGLLLEPSPPHHVKRILVTNDLTPAVMQEAEEEAVNLIVSYHPPIFGPLKSLTQRTWKERLVVRCLENRIAVYSPHTSWDAAAEGVNDWLLAAFGHDIQDKRPIEQTTVFSEGISKKLRVVVGDEGVQALLANLQWLGKDQVYCQSVNTGVSGEGSNTVTLHLSCTVTQLPQIVKELTCSGVQLQHLECSDLTKVPFPGLGMGRAARLLSSISVDTAVSYIKTHLGLQHVRVAKATGQTAVSSVAVCAGSGSSVLQGVKADLYLTGEMSHHDVLDAVSRGVTVVLCDHSNTERGFLTQVQARLHGLLNGQVDVLVSKQDREPLEFV